MDSIILNLPQLADYQPAILALTLLCLMVLIQSFLAGVLGLAPGDQVAGMPLKGSHADKSFRVMRTYANSTENLSVFVATVVLAIVAGVDQTWVNWLVGLHVAIRALYWAVYYAGIGKVAAGPRTVTYVMGWLMNLLLAIMAFYAMVV